MIFTFVIVAIIVCLFPTGCRVIYFHILFPSSISTFLSYLQLIRPLTWSDVSLDKSAVTPNVTLNSV